jgi:type I restriction enzyme S subunit
MDQSRRYTYDRTESVVFLKTNEAYGGLSNMAGGYPLHVNGLDILTSEALYQALRFPHLPDVQRLIIEQKSPMSAKMKSKPHRKNTRPDWDDIRVPLMRWCLQVKLAQNWDRFGELLLSTEDRPIVEQSHRDDFWGAKVQEDGSLVGINVLGRLLMELRDRLCSPDGRELRTVQPLAIPDFLLNEQPLGEIGSRKASEQSNRPNPNKSDRQQSLFD